MALFEQQQNVSQDIIKGETVNKVCTMYLYENRDQRWNNEDVFYLLRYALSGSFTGAPTGEIAEVVGLK